MKSRLPKPKGVDVLSLVEAESELPAAPNTVAVDGREFSGLGVIGGSTDDSFNCAILASVANASIRKSALEDESAGPKLVKEIGIALGAFDAKDEIEGMIAAQAVALHFGAMEALRRSMLSDQPAEIAARLRKDGANLSRAFCDMLDALDRKRGKAQQVVRVERVVVEDGGQAIVGNVNAPEIGNGGMP
jgi:hypothetical protein